GVDHGTLDGGGRRGQCVPGFNSYHGGFRRLGMRPRPDPAVCRFRLGMECFRVLWRILAGLVAARAVTRRMHNARSEFRVKTIRRSGPGALLTGGSVVGASTTTAQLGAGDHPTDVESVTHVRQLCSGHPTP